MLSPPRRRRRWPSGPRGLHVTDHEFARGVDEIVNEDKQRDIKEIAAFEDELEPPPFFKAAPGFFLHPLPLLIPWPPVQCFPDLPFVNHDGQDNA